MSGRTGREENSPIHVADAIRIRESSIRLKEKSRSTAAVDFGGDRAVERKASMQLEASSGVELLDEIKSVRFDLRESEDLSEGEQDALGRTSGLFRDDVLGRTSSVPRRVTTKLKPSARADIGGNENLLPSHTTQEDTATSADKGLLPEMGTSRRGRSEPVIDES